jgi:hypothetical protein
MTAVALSRAVAGYEAGAGPDWFGNTQSFVVWNTGSIYELRDNSHAGASEIRVRTYGGNSILGTCDSEPIAQRSVKTPWPDDEEVSAIHNLGESVSYWKNTFARNGMFSDNAVLTACISGSLGDFGAFYDSGNRTLRFREEDGNDGPSVAGRDVVTHEFTHGVSHAEVGFSGSSLESRAINEAMSDYFGARHRGSSCGAGEVYNGGACVRQINSDSTYQQRYSATNCPDGAGGILDACLGVVVSSALWDLTLASGGAYALETDHTTYQALTNYMTSVMTIGAAREALVRKAKDRAHNEFVSFDLSPLLEQVFWERGVGYAPVSLQLSQANCNQPWDFSWTLTVGGSDGRQFDVMLQSGSSGLNADGSVSYPDDSVDVGSFNPGYDDFQVTRESWQLGDHYDNDGHDHGFRVRFTDVWGGIGWLDYSKGDTPGCGVSPSIVGGTTTGGPPTQFAVRQAIATPGGVVSAAALSARLSGNPEVSRTSLSAHVREHGLTALEVDIPAGRPAAALEVLVYTPQGRLIRRLVTNLITGGTERVVWDGRTAAGSPAPPGVYIVVVRHGGDSKRTHFMVPARPH